MPLLRTHIVTLPFDLVPQCPDECVACGVPAPGSGIRVSDRVFVWGSLLSTWLQLAGRKVTREFPMCLRCRRYDRIVKWGRWATFLTLVILGVSRVYPWAKTLDVPHGVKKLIAMAALLPILLPTVLWPLMFPRPVTLEAGKRVVSYQFARRQYAAQFAARNRARLDRLE